MNLLHVFNTELKPNEAEKLAELHSIAEDFAAHLIEYATVFGINIINDEIKKIVDKEEVKPMSIE